MIVQINDFNIAKIADSGQCFRMRRLSETEFGVIAEQRFLKIAQMEADIYDFSCNETEMPFWSHYFDLDTDYSRFLNAVDKTDGFLRKAMQYGAGLRILRQNPWETMVSFVISQRKSIGAIKTAVEALCRCCGSSFESEFGIVYAFPTPEQLTSVSVSDLKACSVGYRDKYLFALAKRVSSGEVSLDSICNMDDENAKKELMTLYGIGSKVADCILLFGYHRLDAFPVDVWIGRILEREYSGVFPAEKYAGFAGILQQYMFYYAKSREYGFSK